MTPILITFFLLNNNREFVVKKNLNKYSSSANKMKRKKKLTRRNGLTFLNKNVKKKQKLFEIRYMSLFFCFLSKIFNT